jgi:hypothetical protein
MSITSLVAAAAGFAVILASSGASGLEANTQTVNSGNAQCYFVDDPISKAAMMCLQLDNPGREPLWALRNNTDWVLDLDSPGAWHEPMQAKRFPTVTDVTSYLTRSWINDQQYAVLAVQPGETVFMPASVSEDGSRFLLPEGELRFNAEATTAMIAVASAVASADRVATNRSKLYKIVKRAKACATAGSAALLDTDQTSDAYAVVLADLAAYEACSKYFKGVAKQAKLKAPSSWRIVVHEFGDNFFIEARAAAIKLMQFR